MIRKKDETKAMLIGEIAEQISEYVDKMDEESCKERFPISKIEKMLEEIVTGTKSSIVDKTSELLSSLNEEEEIRKKSRNTSREEGC